MMKVHSLSTSNILIILHMFCYSIMMCDKVVPLYFCNNLLVTTKIWLEPQASYT